MGFGSINTQRSVVPQPTLSATVRRKHCFPTIHCSVQPATQYVSDSDQTGCEQAETIAMTTGNRSAQHESWGSLTDA